MHIFEKHSIARTASIALLLLATPLAGTRGQSRISADYWQQEVNYEIEASLDPASHTLEGKETILYTNNSPDTLREFYLHLYANAFREKTSPLIRDYLQGTLHFFVGLPKSMRGSIDISKLAVDDGPVDFKVDGTILTAAFPKPLIPGEKATITLSFNLKIMRRLGRMGWMGQHYDMAQWYPKMAVYDKRGWHPDQYRMGEFYGEFGSFDVSITLPENYVVAATGSLVSGDPGLKKNPLPRTSGDSPMKKRMRSARVKGEPSVRQNSKTVRFRAEKVHDFAWSANPDFVVQDSTINGIHISVFFRSWNRSWQDSVLARSIEAIRWLEDFAGPFPYSELAIVDSPTRGGMEYPMLVMLGSTDESLILHEIAHNYFYAALGNDERAEAWMDEGFVQYCVFARAEEKYGPYGSPDKRSWPARILKRHLLWNGIEKPVVNLHRTGFAERIATPVHEYRNGFSTMPYIGAPLFLRTLRYVVGDEAFEAIIRTYVERWKFKHVDEDAFREVCEEISGVDLSDFFKQWLHTTKACDYRISHIDRKRTEEGWTTTVAIDRKGDLIMPITLAVRQANGNTIEKSLEGISRTIVDTTVLDSRPVSVSINPGNEILDIYRLDNHWPRRRKFSIDLPFDRYYPPDAFSYRLLPIGYYNDIDGGKAGLRLRGSFDNRYRSFALQSLYGFESGAVDFHGSFAHPLGYLGRDASLFAEGFIREGRQGVSISIKKIRRKSLYDPLSHTLTLGLTYHELKDDKYILPFTYEKGFNFKGILGLEMSPKTDIFASHLSFSLERSLWGSDFDIEKMRLSLAFSPAIRASALPIKPSLRFFLGRAMNEPPLQERFQLAGTGTLERERYFWLRSVGAWPEDYYGNFHTAGDANLRGYGDGKFAFKQLFASNLELVLPSPFPRAFARTLDCRTYLFFDWGKVLDDRPLEGLEPSRRELVDDTLFDDFILDAGLGFRIWKLSLEFPVYLSHPSLVDDSKKWDFRWTMGLGSLF